MGRPAHPPPDLSTPRTAAEAQSSSPVSTLLPILQTSFRSSTGKDGAAADPAGQGRQEGRAGESFRQGSGESFGAEYCWPCGRLGGLDRPVEQALSFLGTPTEMGGVSRSGIDCSGLVAYLQQRGTHPAAHGAEQFRIRYAGRSRVAAGGGSGLLSPTPIGGASRSRHLHRRGPVRARREPAPWRRRLPARRGYYQARFVGGRRLLRMPGDDLARREPARQRRRGAAAGEAAGGGR